jgi:hypothetical protein
MNYRCISILAFGLSIAAWGQQIAPAPANPSDNGPTLAATMQYIQEKLSEQGPVESAETRNNLPAVTEHVRFLLADVMADAAACTLYTTETVDYTFELPRGKNLIVGGKSVTADDMRTHIVETDTVSLKQIEKVTVETAQDFENQALAEAAHPEIKATYTPTVFIVKLSASSAVFPSHTSTTKGNQAPAEEDSTGKTSGYTFRDEDTANRVAKAMTHAMELCGGGVTKKELF